MADSSLRSTVRLHKPIQLRAGDVHEQAAVRYLARRDRTEAQIRTYLDRIGASPAQIRRLIAKFYRMGYLDDHAYARRWARNRIARRPMGRERLELELRGQGLDASIIAAAVEELYAETSERELALKLVEAGGMTPGLLRRRGFSEDTIETLFSQMTIESSAVSFQRSAKKQKLRADG
jgi:regulatory protein